MKLCIAACLILLPALLSLAPGCASTEIAVKEKLGTPKRDQLVNRVKDARDEQQEAKQQFSSALDQFLSVTGAGSNPSVAELETKYNALKKEYDRCDSEASTVRSRIQSVKDVADALFKEWKAELTQYTNEQMRSTSQKELDQTKAQYDKLMVSLNAAAKKMDAVLAAFKDQVLFLKHNLNARAISSLQDNAGQIQSDIASLIKQMEASIKESDQFIRQMQASK